MNTEITQNTITADAILSALGYGDLIISLSLVIAFGDLVDAALIHLLLTRMKSSETGWIDMTYKQASTALGGIKLSQIRTALRHLCGDDGSNARDKTKKQRVETYDVVETMIDSRRYRGKDIEITLWRVKLDKLTELLAKKAYIKIGVTGMPLLDLSHIPSNMLDHAEAFYSAFRVMPQLSDSGRKREIQTFVTLINDGVIPEDYAKSAEWFAQNTASDGRKHKIVAVWSVVTSLHKTVELRSLETPNIKDASTSDAVNLNEFDVPTRKLAQIIMSYNLLDVPGHQKVTADLQLLVKSNITAQDIHSTNCFQQANSMPVTYKSLIKHSGIQAAYRPLGYGPGGKISRSAVLEPIIYDPNAVYNGYYSKNGQDVKWCRESLDAYFVFENLQNSDDEGFWENPSFPEDD